MLGDEGVERVEKVNILRVLEKAMISLFYGQYLDLLLHDRSNSHRILYRVGLRITGKPEDRRPSQHWGCRPASAAGALTQTTRFEALRVPPLDPLNPEL